MIVIIPSLICSIAHLIVFNYVRSSSRRIQPSFQITTNHLNNHQQQRINRRDTHLLRHMIIMFSIFVGGWSPIYIYTIINPDISLSLLLPSLFTLLAQSCLQCDIINLFIYNHELSKYLQNIVCKRSPTEL